MKRSSPTLLPLLRTATQGEIIAWLFLHPAEQFTITDLARRLGTSAPTVMREADRLANAGLITEQRIGATRHIRADINTPIFQPLADLMAVTYGPVPVLTDLLALIEGIEKAFIYGSWAARYHEHPGRVPNDLDVLVIGAPDPDDLFDAADTASTKLGRQVNIRRVTRSSWDDIEGADPFIQSVRGRPKVPLNLKSEDL